MDESIYLVDLDRMSVDHENEFLRSLLDWEKAPVLPISKWFEPELELLPHHELDDRQLRASLFATIKKLHQKRIVLEFTGHLSERQLYCLVIRDILPAQEKRVSLKGTWLRWQCIDIVEDEESWLRFYANDEERELWRIDNLLPLPPQQDLPFERDLPGPEDSLA